MAIATSTAIGLALAAAAAGGQYYNTQHTAARQDQAATNAILNQSKIQKQADSAVNDEVAKLQGSNSADEAQTRLDDYMGVLRANRARTENGLTPNVGSTAFQTDAATRATGADEFAAKTAGLMARIDAPQMQRQGEAFSYGNLGTDLGLIGRQSQGQNFIDQLKLNAIRRNAKIDLASGLMSAAGGSMAGAAGSGGGFGFGPGTIGAGV